LYELQHATYNVTSFFLLATFLSILLQTYLFLIILKDCIKHHYVCVPECGKTDLMDIWFVSRLLVVAKEAEMNTTGAGIGMLS
jgi:hypothetical protein